MLSVTFGISMYVFMNSFMAGVNNIQNELAFSTMAHIRIYNDLPDDQTNILESLHSEPHQMVHLRHPRIINYTEGIKHSQHILSFLEQQKGIAAVTPQVNVNVFFQSGITEVNGILSGVDADKEDQLFDMKEYVVQGNWDELNHRNEGVVIGIDLANRLGLHLHDQVLVNTPGGISKSFEIIGIIQTTIRSVDNAKAFVKLSAAQQMIQENLGYATDIQINVHDYAASREVANRIAPFIPFEVEAWQVANGQLEASSTLRDYMALATSLTILIVAGFGIYNIMNMTVNEKIREIAILKAMGFDGGDIVHIFLTQSIVIGFMGGLAGLGMGYLISMLVGSIPFDLASLEHLPMAYRAKDYALGIFFGLLTTFIAGYLPAKKAAAVDPVAILRG